MLIENVTTEMLCKENCEGTPCTPDGAWIETGGYDGNSDDPNDLWEDLD